MSSVQSEHLHGKHTTKMQALLIDEAFEGEVYPSEPMSRHTTYRIGGPARFYVRVNTLGALMQLVEACKEEDIPWMVVGRGSNLLVSDDGFDGVIIVLGQDFKNLAVDEDLAIINAGAGVLLSAVVQEAFKRSLAGFEFAVGTPGTIGGAIRMNAGSRDEWIGSKVKSVTILDGQGNLKKLKSEEITWEYRKTSFAPDDTVLECELVASKSDPFYIRGKMEANLSKRKANQPLHEPSCGSVFKNPPSGSAGAMIDACGLKGYCIGGARISTKHANFIVNEGSATAADVVELIELIKSKVLDSYGVQLQTEVKFVGF